MLGVSASTLRRLEENRVVQGYGLTVHYTPGGQRRYRLDEIRSNVMRRGFARRLGFGDAPAVIAVNLTRGFLDPDSPMGYELGHIVGPAAEVLSVARRAGIPVAFTVTHYDEESIAARLRGQKMPVLQVLQPGSPWVAVDRRMHRREHEPTFYSGMMSHLRDNGLGQYLSDHKVDTVILIGCSTSGAVRMSAIESLQLGLRPMVVSEAVGDRNDVTHRSNLSDLDHKYADVLHVSEVLSYLQGDREPAE